MTWHAATVRITLLVAGGLLSGPAFSQTTPAPVEQSLPPSPDRPIGLITSVATILAMSADSLQDLNNGDTSVKVPDRNDLQARLKADAREKVSLVEAIRLTGLRSFPVQAAQARDASARDDVRAAWGGFLPNIAVRAASGYENSAPASILDPVTGLVELDSEHIRRELTATVTQPIFDLAALNEIRRARAVRDAVHATLNGTQDSEAISVINAYLDLIRSSLTLNLTHAHMARLNKLLDYTTKRVAGGGTSAADGQRVRERVLSAQANAEDALGGVDRALITFGRLTGVVPGEVPLKSLAGSALPASLQTAYDEFETNSPVIAEARAQELAARRQYQENASRFLPNIGLEVSKTSVENAGGLPGWQTDKRALLVVSIPLNPWGTYQLAKSGRDKERALGFDLDEARRQGRESLNIAYNALQTAAAKVLAIRGQVDAGAKVVEAYDVQMGATNRSLLDVMDSYDQFYQANVNLVTASTSAATLYYNTLLTLGRLRPTLSQAPAD